MSGLSIAGYRNMGERANLTIRYAEITSRLKPKWFVMENVYNMERMPVLPRQQRYLRMRDMVLPQDS
jgi:DNA (cytosine-5)-methyltransferase 1